MKYYISQSPLPSPESVISEATDMAWTEILNWSAAATGILITILLIRSFISSR